MIYALNPNDPTQPFPDVEKALREPDGLLAIGGDLSPQRLIRAYRQGIFPWFSDRQPILWWSPDPRSVLFPHAFKVSRSLRKVLKKGTFKVTFDECFHEVINACAGPRRDGEGTWITPDMLDAYQQLHQSGIAHSVETWFQGQLVGGLYGVALGRVFFGESMFSWRSDASKVALTHLVESLKSWQFGLIDCQIESEHLNRLGALSIPRRRFVKLLDEYCAKPGKAGPWRTEAMNAQ